MKAAASGPFNRSPTVPLPCCAPGRCIDVHRTMPSVIAHVRVGAARPNAPIRPTNHYANKRGLPVFLQGAS
jgi:hypothetical protein